MDKAIIDVIVVKMDIAETDLEKIIKYNIKENNLLPNST